MRLHFLDWFDLKSALVGVVIMGSIVGAINAGHSVSAMFGAGMGQGVYTFFFAGFVIQMVGKRYNLADTEPWGSASPSSNIVLIGSRGGVDADGLDLAFKGCIGTGDNSASPVLRLTRKLGLAG